LAASLIFKKTAQCKQSPNRQNSTNLVTLFWRVNKNFLIILPDEPTVQVPEAAPLTCPPRGLLSLGPCKFDAPLAVSWPHFYKADSALFDAVQGKQSFLFVQGNQDKQSFSFIRTVSIFAKSHKWILHIVTCRNEISNGDQLDRSLYFGLQGSSMSTRNLDNHVRTNMLYSRQSSTTQHPSNVFWTAF
jgi:hypothetical protein